MSKATHIGTCQICGATQMLPGGVLAKHGYTTKWGFFSGTCAGSHFLPFEQSIDRIEQAIAMSQSHEAELRFRAAAERVNADPTDVMAHIYVGFQGRGLETSKWLPTTVSAVENVSTSGDYRWLSYTLTYAMPGYVRPGDAPVMKTKRLESYEGEKTLDATVLKLRGRYADMLVKEADARAKYTKWQQDRIRNWAPAPLVPRTR